MKRDKYKDRVQHSLFSLRGYFFFVVLVALVSTISILLLLHSAVLDEEFLRQNAPLTLINILALSLLFTFIDGQRRRWTYERPVNRMLKAIKQLTDGEFDAHIEPMHIPESMNEFDLMIEGINKLAEELRSVETLRSDFVANVSHELKTPLSVMQNYGMMLSQPGLSEDKRLEYAGEVVRASRRLSDLVSNFLKLNRLENQQIYPKAEPFDLSEQLRECMLGFEELLDKKELILDADVGDGVMASADRELLSIVWNNLIANAIKFTDAGGQISVHLAKENQGITVTVSDTGCGMSQDTGERIFEKFYQGDTSHAVQGNGLGLALVKRVIDIVGGDISVQSTLGKGSSFTVWLPGDAHETV